MLRVLIANRGVVALRLVKAFQGLGMETVSAFCAPDVERPYVQQADFDVYLNGETVAETFLSPDNVLSAAVDAGCDVIHPGTCFLAERPELGELASRASVAVVAPDPDVLDRVTDRFQLYDAARALAIPIVPTSPGPLAPGVEAISTAAPLGYPLYVKAVRGGAVRAVPSEAELQGVVDAVRSEAQQCAGCDEVYLQRVVRGRLRRIGTVVVADQHHTAMAVGHTDTSLAVGPVWIEELGEVVSEELSARLSTWSEELVNALGFWGVGTVRWAVTADGGAYLLSFSARLTTGYRLVELVHGIDLVRTQFRMMAGERIGWDRADAKPRRHAVQLRVVHGDGGASRPPGVVSELALPPGVEADLDVDVGDEVHAGNDRLLATLSTDAPTRQAALVRVTAAAQAMTLDGVQSNLAALRRLLDDQQVWRGEHDVSTAAATLA